MNDIKPIKFCGVDSKRPVVIAGPCSAETEEQVMETAKDLAKNGVRIFRAAFGNRAPNRADSKVWAVSV